MRGTETFPRVVGEVSISSILGNKERSRKSYNQRNANKNKKAPTLAEVKFKSILNKLEAKFQEQYPLDGKYILDFFVFDTKIGFEIDGGYHKQPKQKDKDRLKEKACRKNGIRLVRYKNEEVIKTPLAIESELKEKLGIEEHKPKTSESRKIFMNFEEALDELRQTRGTLKQSDNGGWFIKE